jgi:hypothetical protein
VGKVQLGREIKPRCGEFFVIAESNQSVYLEARQCFFLKRNFQFLKSNTFEIRDDLLEFDVISNFSLSRNENMVKTFRQVR